MQDYKSQGVVVMIYATLVNPHTAHTVTQSKTGYTIGSAS